MAASGLPSRLAGVLFAALLLAGCAGNENAGNGAIDGDLKTGPGVTDDTILLGQHTVLTGNFAAVTAPIPMATDAYFRYVNEEEGGVCGRRIAFRYRDDEYSPARALEVSRKLVEQDGIAAFVGNFGTPSHLGAIDYINDPNADGDTADGIPDLFLSTGSPKWGDASKWPWSIGYIPDYTSEGTILAHYVNEAMPGKTAAILYQNDDYGETARDGFLSAFEGAVVAEESYEATAPEVTSQSLNLLASKPDIIYLASTPAYTVQAMVTAIREGASPQFLVGYTNANTTLAALLGGGSAPEQLAEGFRRLEGVISTAYLMTVPQNETEAAVVKHKEIMAAYDGPPLSTLSIYGQSLAETVVETLRRACDARDLTREGILRAAESLRGFVTSLSLPGVEVNLGPDDHLAFQALQVVRIKGDGTLKLEGPIISLEH
jgi:branched-chain amino acid transport system substrate-binding protein